MVARLHALQLVAKRPAVGDFWKIRSLDRRFRRCGYGRRLPRKARTLCRPRFSRYNAYTLKLVADAYPIESIHDLGTGGRILGWLLNKSPWDIRFAEVGGEEYTLNEIEHEILRVDFDEPRIHFAVVCAAISCPPLRSEAYVPERLDEQLDAQARQFVADRRSNRFNLSWQRAEVSPIFSWFEEDFGDDDSAVLLFLAEVAPPTTGEAIRQAPGKWSLDYTPYNWSLNDQP